MAIIIILSIAIFFEVVSVLFKIYTIVAPKFDDEPVFVGYSMISVCFAAFVLFSLIFALVKVI